MFTGLLAATLFSCKKENEWVDNGSIGTPPERAHFIKTPLSGDFYIVSTPTGGSFYNIPVGLTTASNTDRTVSFTYSSNRATAGTQFSGPASITIPAGSTVDTLRIQGLFSGYPTGRRDTIVVKINKTGSDVLSAGFSDTFRLIAQKYCPVSLAELEGAYTRTFEGTYGPYVSTVEELVSTGATSATGIITNIYDSGIRARATFDWSNPAQFRVTIAGQSTGIVLSNGLELFVRTNAASASSFSSCDQTITMNFQLYTSAGVYDTWTSRMAR